MYRPERPGEVIGSRQLFSTPKLRDCGPLILTTAIGLGLLLAGRQFLVPTSLKTWAFTLHRSLSPAGILLAKVTAAAIGLCLAVGLIWTVLFLYAYRPGAARYAPRPVVLAEGWLMVATGLVVYFGAAVSAIRAAKWHTTRIFPLAFAVGLLPLALVQWGIARMVVVMLIGLAILVSQLIHIFLNREF